MSKVLKNEQELLNTFGSKKDALDYILRDRPPVQLAAEDIGRPYCEQDTYTIICDETNNEMFSSALRHFMDGFEEYGLRSLVTGVERVKVTEKFAALDAKMQTLDLTPFPSIGLVGILRYTFRIKSRLSGWGALYARIEEELTLRGEPTEQILRGLE